MRITEYDIHRNYLELTFVNGEAKTLFLNGKSGRAFYRYKLYTLSQVKHTGIFIGIDHNGTSWYIHNHTVHGHATVVSEKVFLQGKQLHEYPAEAQYPPLIVLERAFENARKGEPYHLLRNNCQTFTNWSLTDKGHSQDIRKFTSIGGVSFGLLAAGIGWFLIQKGKD